MDGGDCSPLLLALIIASCTASWTGAVCGWSGGASSPMCLHPCLRGHHLRVPATPNAPNTGGPSPLLPPLPSPRPFPALTPPCAPAAGGWGPAAEPTQGQPSSPAAPASAYQQKQGQHLLNLKPRQATSKPIENTSTQRFGQQLSGGASAGVDVQASVGPLAAQPSCKGTHPHRAQHTHLACGTQLGLAVTQAGNQVGNSQLAAGWGAKRGGWAGRFRRRAHWSSSCRASCAWRTQAKGRIQVRSSV